MSLNKYTSNIKLINHNEQVVFNYLSNFQNLSSYLNSGLIEKITERIPQIKITDFSSDQDSCKFNITGMGLAEIRITNRECRNVFSDTIKFSGYHNKWAISNPKPM